MPSASPSFLGSYRLLKRLGEGGMGVVYIGMRKGSAKRVAVKTVRVGKAALLGSMRREIEALATLRHPGIIPILDHGADRGVSWYAMPLMEGTTLRDYITALTPSRRDLSRQAAVLTPTKPLDAAVAGMASASTETLGLGHPCKPRQRSRLAPSIATQPRKLANNVVAAVQDAASGASPTPPHRPQAAGGDLPTALTLIRGICRPLAYLHSEGFVHRDLKPENILVTTEGTPVLADFGLFGTFAAKSSRERLQVGGRVSGTLAYMAPEQARGEVVDARADLYSLGCILYELLTGRRPFTGRTAAELVRRHATAPVEPPSRLVTDVSPELDDLVCRLLAKKPQDRVGYADDVASLLSRLEPEDNTLPEAARMSYLYRARLTGRDDVMERLGQAVKRVARERGGLLLIRGESGVGKTRLATELASRAREEGVTVLAGGCGESERGIALCGLRGPLQTLADRCMERGLSETERLFGARGKLMARYEPSLGDLPGQESYPEPSKLPAEPGRLRVLAFLAETFRELVRSEAVLLALDDLQWADELTIDLLETLWRTKLCSDRLLVLGICRSEGESEKIARIASLPNVETIDLGRLSEDAVAGVIQDMLAMEKPPKLFVSFLAAQSEGNPLFVAEYIRTAVDRGLLWRDSRGTWQIGREEGVATMKTYESLGLPGSIKALIMNRVTVLSDPARRLIDLAAVFGREIRADLLSKAWGGSPPVLPMRELQKRRILEDEGNRFSFVHDKIREALLAEIQPERLQRLQRQAALAIEGISGPDDLQTALAEHWEKAGEPEKASVAYLAAARRSVSRYAHDDAEAAYRSYLRLVGEPTEESIRARTTIGLELFYRRGRMREARLEFEAAVNESDSIGHDSLRGQALRRLGIVLSDTGKRSEAVACFTQALSIHRRERNLREEASTLVNIANLRRTGGKPDEARRLLRQAISVSQLAGDVRLEALALVNFSSLPNLHSGPGKAQQALMRALELADRSGDRTLYGATLGNLAEVQGAFDSPTLAVATYEKALKISREVGNRISECATLGGLASLSLRLGHYQPAQDAFVRAIDIAKEIGNRRLEATHLANLGLLDFQAGHLRQGRERVERALDMAREIGNPWMEGLALDLMALLLSAEGDLDAACRAGKKSIDLLCNTGDRRGAGGAMHHATVLHLLFRGSVAEAGVIARRAEEALSDTGDRLELAKLGCTRGHIALAGGNSGQALLSKTEKLLRDPKRPSPKRIPGWMAWRFSRDLGTARSVAKSGHRALTGGALVPSLKARHREARKAAVRRPETLSARVNLGIDAEFRIYAGKLSRAQAAFDAGEPLVCGYAPPDITAGQRRWLMVRRREAIPTSVFAEWSAGTKT